MKQDRRASAGFTLLELLVGLTLLAFLSLIFVEGLRFGLHAWRSAQLRSDRITTLRAAQTVITTLFAHVQATYASPDASDPRVDFTGLPQDVSAIAPLPEAVDPGIMARQHLGLVETPGGRALALTWRLDLPGVESAPPPETVSILLDDVRSLRLRYWGAAEPGRPEAWQDRWEGQTHLPELIDVAIIRTDATLAFTVAPSPTTTPACRYDPIGPSCHHAR